MTGIYVHTHWSYRYPYAARTWTLADWRGFIDGVARLGYDALMIWPQLETMPDPLTPSDAAFLALLREVIEEAHRRAMRVIITAAPNVIAGPAAARHTFAERPWFAAEQRFDPHDSAALEAMIATRRRQFAALGNADALTIIDSDPGGWIGSPDSDFAELVRRTVAALREDRPDLEFIYWMLIGWSNYNRFWEAARDWRPGDPHLQFEWDEAAFRAVLPVFAEQLGEPWSLFAWQEPHLKVIAELGLRDRCWYYPYGLIEGEPTYPLINCTPEPIAEAVAKGADCPLGFMANAQTHCLQIPNLHFVAQACQGRKPSLADLNGVARELLPAAGPTVAAAWRAIAHNDPRELRSRAADVDRVRRQPPEPGPLGGLLFGSASRFLNDLADNLRIRAALADLPAGGDPRPALAEFLAALAPYQRRVGYVDACCGPFYDALFPCLHRLKDPQLNALLDRFDDWRHPETRHGVIPALLARLTTLVD